MISEIICDVKLGKPDMLQKTGRNSVRSDDGIAGNGDSKKRMATCNELYRGSKFALTRKGYERLEPYAVKVACTVLKKRESE